MSDMAHAECVSSDSVDATDTQRRLHATFNVDGMRCGNCANSVQATLRALSGVSQATVNAATAKASVEWDPHRTTLTKIFRAVSDSGFTPAPLAGIDAEQGGANDRRLALKRIGIAGLGMMQTMMFVYALYAGGEHGINESIAQYLRIAGMLLTTPVLVYSGRPFFEGAIRDLRQWRLGMDVPVAFALLLAFCASVLATFRGSGQIYFDSVTMFIFLLSVGRFCEMSVRQKSLSTSEALARSVPKTCLRFDANGATQRVPVEVIAQGDRLSILTGSMIPVDSDLDCANASVDESLLTGESRPLKKSRGEGLLGGSINVGRPIAVLCKGSVEASTLAGIVDLLRRAAAGRPKVSAGVDRAASAFSVGTVILAFVVAIVWLMFDPAKAMNATLAVLVITCPCALSLAIPATYAAATAHLARLGMLVIEPDALTRLANVDTVVLDKTGTLTDGVPVARVLNCAMDVEPEAALSVAAALEQHSDHPLAKAFEGRTSPDVLALDPREYEGQGVEGAVNGRKWRLGRPRFVAELNRAAAFGSNAVDVDPIEDSILVLGNDEGFVAAITISDSVSDATRTAIPELMTRGLRVVIASGDSNAAVERAALDLGVAEFYSRMTPSSKLQFVQQRQAAGARVMMVGDGINDGPVLSTAYVSCAMTQGSSIAQAASDLLLMNGSVRALAASVRVARRARQIIWQNLGWALAYNLVAVPLAAAGMIAPWIAAVGMSTSSLVVVLNAARLAGVSARERL
jgi:P-type Cu2+ transporter